MLKRLIIFFALVVFEVPLFAQHTDHYNKRINQFDSEKQITSKDIVFLGNSLTEGGDWAAFFPKINKRLERKGGRIVNRGIVGDDAPGIYERLYQILPYKPKKIFLLVGVNDISHHLTADSVANAIAKVVDKIREESPDTKLYMQTLLPINESFKRYKNLNGKTNEVGKVNVLIKKIAKERKLKCIDLYPLFLSNEGVLEPSITKDGLHINRQGYNIWIKAIKKYVK